MTKGKRIKKSCISGTISGITMKCNTEQTLVHCNQASFPLAQTKNKTKTVELSTTKYSVQSKDTVLNLDGLDTIHNRK